ncbi:hypothetical protein CYPRO_0294 [Cyclonatronum proteinivorum]|uniref:Uncharacterized protein n=1 Tax=Cyclonatronum proteinivorum TaxID=1457365 RepID=A0A345UGI0_9BACT|nr:hypothetical protein [Cyclonatronum proteinivorum]AXI99581.1 hypothetical protein CYPRO_0294 [Cyclonatronum proteinivorum]
MAPICYSRYFILLVITSIALTAWSCSKENPVNVLPDEVAGTYDFSRYEFVPLAAAIQPANVLDTLVAANTFLRLTEGGQFLLNYQFLNSPESIIAGSFTLDANQIQLQPSPGSEARLASLLLQTPIRFDRVTVPGEIRDGLEMANSQTVDLNSFSDQYEGLPPVPGVLFINLIPRN